MATKKATKKTAAKKAAPAKKTAPNKKAAAPKKAAAKKNEPVDESGMLEDLFKDGLKDIYWAEKALTKALPKMQKAATSQELKDAMQDHLAVTQEQVARLEEVFELMGNKAQAKKCDAMAGLIEEANGIIEETEKGTFTRDVGIILAAQKVEHYEIASYGGLAQLARTIGLDDVAELLAETLAEEKEADELLTQIAENNINERAADEDQDDEEEDEESDDEEADDEE